MDLERFKRLEEEVIKDLYDYINKTRTVCGFNPKYRATRPGTQVYTWGWEGVRRRSTKPPHTVNPLLALVTPFKSVDRTAPLSEESLQGYKLLAQFAWI